MEALTRLGRLLAPQPNGLSPHSSSTASWSTAGSTIPPTPTAVTPRARYPPFLWGIWGSQRRHRNRRGSDTHSWALGGCKTHSQEPPPPPSWNHHSETPRLSALKCGNPSAQRDLVPHPPSLGRAPPLPTLLTLTALPLEIAPSTGIRHNGVPRNSKLSETGKDA